jgi:hypothetical protein
MFASLCLLWHLIEQPREKWSSGISADVAHRVADFMQKFLLPHAIAFYRSVYALADDHERLTAVAGFILARKLERLTNRDIQRSVRRSAIAIAATSRAYAISSIPLVGSRACRGAASSIRRPGS